MCAVALFMCSAFIYRADVCFVDGGLVMCVPVVTNMYVCT
jgi:hypothetical protein